MRRGLAGVLGLLIAFTAACVRADTDPLDTVSRSLRAGDTQAALRELQSLPAEGDARARFLRGTALASAGRLKEATKIFQGLIEDYPKLLEPYNNLAALYARQNRLDKAKEVLEQAIRTDESYATVYENLSAIYVEMARDSYVKALRLDDDRRPPNLQLLYALHRGETAKTLVAQASGQESLPPAAPVKTAAVDKAPVTEGAADVAANDTPKPEAPAETKPQDTPEKVVAVSETAAAPAVKEAPQAQTPSQPQTEAVAPAASPVQVAAREPAASPDGATDDEGQPADAAPAEAKPEPPVSKAAEGGANSSPAAQDAQTTLQASVRQMLEGWAKAWSTQQVEQYLACYVPDFQPSAGQSHESWVAERRRRLSKPDQISVTLESFDIRERAPDKVIVRVWQHYRSDRYQDKTHKKFVLVRGDDNWMIASEKSLEIIRQ